MMTLQDMQRRYEYLKAQYFSRGGGTRYDEDGQEVPSILDRSQIVAMFENMGVELPITPDQPMTLKKQSSSQ